MQAYPQGAMAWVLAFEPGDEVLAGLTEFVLAQGILAARFMAIGAFARSTIAFFERTSRTYRHIPVDQQVEVCSLLGNVALFEGRPRIHAHVVLGLPDGHTLGGHLMEGHVWPTLEVFLDVLPGPLERVTDPESGLALLNRS